MADARDIRHWLGFAGFCMGIIIALVGAAIAGIERVELVTTIEELERERDAFEVEVNVCNARVDIANEEADAVYEMYDAVELELEACEDGTLSTAEREWMDEMERQLGTFYERGLRCFNAGGEMR